MLEGQEGVASVRFVPSDEWDRTADPRCAPAFVAGVWFDTTPAISNAIESDVWGGPAQDGVFVSRADDESGLRKILYLGELVTAGTTLTEQGEALGRWAKSSIADICRVLKAIGTTPTVRAEPSGT